MRCLLVGLGLVLSGCLGAVPGEPPEARTPAPESAAGTAHVLRTTTNHTALTGTPCLPSGEPGCSHGVNSEFKPLALPRPGPSRATLVATWRHTVGPDEEAEVRVWRGSEGGGAPREIVAHAAGRSPLTLELDVALLGDARELVVSADPSTGHVLVNQTVHYELTVTYVPS